jgi:hypothetical protein
MRPCLFRIALAIGWLGVGATAAFAQAGIAGVVRDTTGAVLPGVTVEATSPVLIEKVRAVVTNEQGHYDITNLRPGLYSVAFALAGFTSVKREGIELTGSFTASINVELRVGGIEETVTVSSASPVVDVRSNVQERVMTRTVLDTIPTAKTLQTLAVLVPGVTSSGFGDTQDVGGQVGDNQVQLAIHGSRYTDTAYQMDGMRFNNQGGSSYGQVQQNISVQEVQIQTGALSPESQAGGIAINMIPKDGGNTFKGTVIANWTGHGLQSNNLSDDLKNRGLQSVNRTDKIWDAAVGFGGPIKTNKVWFYASHSYNYRQDFLAGDFFSSNPSGFNFAPDFGRPAPEDIWDQVDGARLTWQADQKNKLTMYADNRGRCVCHWYTANLISPEASTRQNVTTNFLGQAHWTATLTNRLLLEAGVTIYRFNYNIEPQEGIDFTTYSIRDLGTGWLYRSAASYGYDNFINPLYKASASYVTGSHAIKVGFSMDQVWRHRFSRANDDATLQYLNGVPVQVTYSAPTEIRSRLNANLGVFAQDTWTVNRMTLNLGLRYDYFNASVPPQSVPAGLYVPARDFPETRTDVPNWKDLSPRIGLTFDLFGNGKTALKASVSRYVTFQLNQISDATNPVTTTSNSATRAWRDMNGDGIPEGDPLNPLPNGELIGPLTNPNFGKVVVTTQYDPAVLDGWFKRPYNWEIMTGIQHELWPRISVGAAYFRRWYGNFTTSQNLLRAASDYDPFCVTTPADARLPGGGGNQLCGFYDVNPATFSATTNNVVTFVNQSEIYNGIDLTINARLTDGLFFAGGLNGGRTAFNNCTVLPGNSPQPAFTLSGYLNTVNGNSYSYCDLVPPFVTQFKAIGGYLVPRAKVQLSAAVQSLPGSQILATWAAPSSIVAASLGRPLAGNAVTTSIQLMSPATYFGDRLNQIDLRVSKSVRVFHGRRVSVNVDLFNALNANPVTQQNNNVGAQWLRPTSILAGRLLKFGTQIEF